MSGSFGLPSLRDMHPDCFSPCNIASMSRSYRRREAVFLVILSCFAGSALRAAPPGAPSRDRLVMTVILSRHGLRSPLVPLAQLDRYAVLPWPVWPVAPGALTRRGFSQLTAMGSFDHALLAREGMFVGKGCAAARSAYIWTDTDQRTIASGHALAEGLFTGCPVAVHQLPQGSADPLFHPDQHHVPADIETAALIQVRACAKPDPQWEALIDRLQILLLDCVPGRSCHPANMPPVSVKSAPLEVRPSTQDDVIHYGGSLPLASSLAEDFELEYMQGLPMQSVAWGHLSLAALQRLIALHTHYIACLNETPALAHLGASDLLAHIVATLRQAVEQHPDPAAIAPLERQLVLLDGHDSNLVGVAALLGLHWRLDSRADDTPPASQIMFQVWKSPQGHAFVRVNVQMPTLVQMRTLAPLSLTQPPAQKRLVVRGCFGRHDCAWATFQTAASRAVDPRFVR
jgi:4-phytase/acid phosphatase